MFAEQRRRETVRGVVAVVERDGRFLMIQRAAHVAAPGAWCFPGGAIQRGETHEDAIRREMMEELGVRVDPVEELWRWRREDGGLELSWWRADLREGKPRPNPVEVQRCRWMTPDEIRSTANILPNNLTFLDEYLGAS